MQELQLNKAPITEAVIEIRTVPAPNVTAESLQENIKLDNYPSVRPTYEGTIEGEMQAGQEPTVKTAHSLVGYRYTHTNDKQILQIRPSIFTFNRLAPYGSWAEFSNEAKSLWNVFRIATNPETISRVAVRYINRIDIPLPITDLKEYLRTYPEVSPDMGQALSGYFMRLESPQPDISANLVLHQAMIPPPSENVVSVLLDIDLYRDKDLPIEESKLWTLLESLRNKKNEIFKSCLNEKTMRLFE